MENIKKTLDYVKYGLAFIKDNKYKIIVNSWNYIKRECEDFSLNFVKHWICLLLIIGMFTGIMHIKFRIKNYKLIEENRELVGENNKLLTSKNRYKKLYFDIIEFNSVAKDLKNIKKFLNKVKEGHSKANPEILKLINDLFKMCDINKNQIIKYCIELKEAGCHNETLTEKIKELEKVTMLNLTN